MSEERGGGEGVEGDRTLGVECDVGSEQETTIVSVHKSNTCWSQRHENRHEAHPTKVCILPSLQVLKVN